MESQYSDEALGLLAESIGQEMKTRGHKLTIAESCTGGWISKLCTDQPGSSTWFDRGFVSYSNAGKQEMLGVGAAALARHGAVSEKVASEMVSGALERSDGDMAVAVSGIAGPDGGTPDKPVGTVCFAWQRRDGMVTTEICHFNGDRDAVRRASVAHAFRGLQEHVLDEQPED